VKDSVLFKLQNKIDFCSFGKKDKKFSFELTKGDFLYKCYGLLSLIGAAVLLGATLGLIGAVAYGTYKFLSGSNSKGTKSKSPYAMYGYS